MDADHDIHDTLKSSLSNLKLSRDNALNQEISQVKKVNQVLETVNQSLDKSESNITAIEAAVHNANELLDVWVKIMSQTQKTRELLEDSQWHGLTSDDELYQQRLARLQELAEQKRIEEQQLKAQRELRKQKDSQKAAQKQRMQRKVYGSRR